MKIKHETQILEDIDEPILDVDISDKEECVAITETKFWTPQKCCSLPFITHLAKVRKIKKDRFLVTGLQNYDHKKAFIIDGEAKINSSFSVGVAIKDIVVCSDYLVITYFDEAYSENGISVFDHNGNFQFGYMPEFGSEAENVFDCYACTQIGSNTIMFYCYTEFPLVMLDLDQRKQKKFHPPELLYGSDAISKKVDCIYFYSPYSDEDGIYEWAIGSDLVKAVGKYPSQLRGLPNGDFLSTTTNGYTIVSVSNQ